MGGRDQRIGQVLARRHGGQDQTGNRERGQVLQAVDGDIDALQARVAELEERVDFTERLLAQNREPDRLQR